MALPIYSTGTVSVAVGGTVVTNVGGLWSGINVKQGDFISINGLPAVLITEVTDTTHLKIPPWGGAAQTNVAYVIYQNYVGRVVGVAAAEDVGDMLERLRDQAPIYNVPAGETEPDPSYGTDGQYAYQVGTNTWWVKDAGVWVLQAGPPGTVGGPGATPFDALAYNGMQVNGSGEVSQENGSTAVIAGPSGAYPVDCWKGYSSGTQIITTGRASAPGGFGASVQLVCSGANTSPASGHYAMLMHAVEGYRVSRLNWGVAGASPVTLGFWVASKPAGNYSGAIRNANNTRTYPFTITVNAQDVWEYKTVSIPGDTAGTWPKDNGQGLNVAFTMMAHSSLLGAANAWSGTNYIGVTGSVNGVAASGNYFNVTGLVILPGISAPTAAQSPLIMRPYDQELVTCQRYWERVEGEIFGYQTAGGYMEEFAPFKVMKRAAPTLSAVSWTSTGNATSQAANQATQYGCVFSAAAVATGTFYFRGMTTDADARL
jgi:hypothetical protein